MNRLTETAPFPLDSFHRCQICGYSSTDICKFALWWECGGDDNYDENSPTLLTCRQDACLQVIQDHDRLYLKMPWSQGGPGKFILICGPCPHRDGSRCNHPNLKANGGDGLDVKYTKLFNGPIHINRSDGRSGFVNLNPFTECEGYPDKDQRP